jgi:hypothetical protein
MITQDGINFIYNTLKNGLYKAQVLVNGQYKDVNIQKVEVTTNSIKIFVYVDETVAGQITQYRLITVDGKTFLTRSENITKDNTRGLLTVFEIKLQEV